jgi:DNA-binding LacI/PurR family transcriptional regulator
MYTQYLPASMEALFEEALKAREATAWVALNDVGALMALQFLRRSRVPVPQAISVIGFDDTVESFRAGLSSYNFNVAQVVRTAVDDVANRGGTMRARAQVSPGAVYCPGYVVARQSTARARRA